MQQPIPVPPPDDTPAPQAEAAARVTPMMEQYLEIKAANPATQTTRKRTVGSDWKNSTCDRSEDKTASKAIVEAVGDLRALGRLDGPVREIHRLENLADRLQRDAVAALFADRNDPVDVIKWKDVYDTLEEATDQAEDVANVLESIRTKNL